MAGIEEIRRANLLLLIDQHGGQKPLAEAVDKAPAQISQWVNRSPDAKNGRPRTMGTRAARDFEARLSLPEGWMDRENSGLPDGVKEDSSIYPLQAAPLQASQSVRPDFERMGAAVFLLREFLANAMFDPELLFDRRMLEMAWEGVEYAGSETEPSNVLDFMKFMRKRMEERGVSVRQVEAKAARRGNG